MNGNPYLRCMTSANRGTAQWCLRAGTFDYEGAQAFVGGALSVYAGSGKHIKGKKLASKPFLKGLETFGKYGIQSTAYDFAYTDRKYYVGEHGRTWYEHLGMFAAGGAAGVTANQFFNSKDSDLATGYKMGIGAATYAAEWAISSRLKYAAYARHNGYSPSGFYTGRSQTAKGVILGSKWIEQSWNILIAK